MSAASARARQRKQRDTCKRCLNTYVTKLGSSACQCVAVDTPGRADIHIWMVTLGLYRPQHLTGPSFEAMRQRMHRSAPTSAKASTSMTCWKLETSTEQHATLSPTAVQPPTTAAHDSSRAGGCRLIETEVTTLAYTGMSAIWMSSTSLACAATLALLRSPTKSSSCNSI